MEEVKPGTTASCIRRKACACLYWIAEMRARKCPQDIETWLSIMLLNEKANIARTLHTKPRRCNQINHATKIICAVPVIATTTYDSAQYSRRITAVTFVPLVVACASESCCSIFERGGKNEKTKTLAHLLPMNHGHGRKDGEVEAQNEKV